MLPAQPHILLTGATDGIGRTAALELARRGARLLLHGRNAAKLQAIAGEVRALGAQVATIRADFASLAEVRAMAAEVLAEHAPIDVLVNNAGVYMTELRHTIDGFETTFAVNHLAPFLLTELLLPSLPAHGRILNTSSIAHTRGELDFENLNAERGFDGYATYALSKLANVLHTVELARRLGPVPTVNALHPGVVSTKLLKKGFGIEGPDSLEQGAETTVFLALDPSVAEVTGRYFRQCREARTSTWAADAAACERFYEVSRTMVGLGA